MIPNQAVYRKTLKGTEAIANRQAGLVPKLRSALIMVDGKRRFGDLTPLVSVLGDAQLLVSELESLGLIEQIGAAVPAPAPAAEAGQVPVKIPVPQAVTDTVPSPLAGPHTLASVKRFTTRLLTELLGPMAETPCLKIEASRDMAEFISAVKRARDIVREVRGQTASDQFVNQVEINAPQP